MNKAQRKINYTLSLSFIFIVFVVVSFFTYEVNREKDRYESIIQDSFKQLAINISEAVKVKDRTSVGQYLYKSVLYERYKNIEVTTDDGFVLFSKYGVNCNSSSLDSYRIFYNRNVVGYIKPCRRNLHLDNSLYWGMLIFLVVIVILIYYFLIKKIYNSTNPLSSFVNSIERMNIHSDTQLELSDSVRNDEDLSLIALKINSVIKSIVDINNIASNEKIIEKELVISRQLAHDIRSPLAALDIAIKTISCNSPEQKQLIRSALNRINDIANNLIEKTNRISSEKLVKSTIITSVLSSIISEKRTEFRDKSHIVIDFFINNHNYALFSNIEVGEFKRIISNLINNSVESIIQPTGYIEIQLSSTFEYNEILIIDDGKGIPDDVKSNVFEDGCSIDKVGGTGIGLFHAKETLLAWNGNLSFSSKVDVGTTFRIRIPKSAPPKTFVSAISIKDVNRIVIVDDDLSIHQVWKGRFGSLNLNHYEILTFTNPDEFLEWLKTNNNANNMYLFDYEYLGHRVNGFDLMDKVAGNDKYLITSRYEEDEIKIKCDKENFKLVDKGMISFVPITVLEDIKKILIDDDELIHMSWKVEADKTGVKLDCFFTIAEFLAVSDEYDEDVVIYIDSNLADGVKGEIESEKIFNAGFKNIYLATGYSPSDFEKPSWIKEIVGKRAKFN